MCLCFAESTVSPTTFTTASESTVSTVTTTPTTATTGSLGMIFRQLLLYIFHLEDADVDNDYI